MDLGKLMEHKEKTVMGLTGGIEGLLKKYKVDYFKGTGEILKAGAVKVNGLDGEVQTLDTKNIVIATGSVPASLPGVPVDEKIITTSTGALDLKEIPKKMIVIGAGVIGLEMGSVWRRLGTEVTVVEFLDHITPGLDSEIATTFHRVLKKQGMKFKMSTKVAGAATLTVEPVKGGDAVTMDADIVLLATGRVPFTEGLGLENVGIKVGARGMVEVDDHFATNVP